MQAHSVGCVPCVQHYTLGQHQCCNIVKLQSSDSIGMYIFAVSAFKVSIALNLDIMAALNCHAWILTSPKGVLAIGSIYLAQVRNEGNIYVPSRHRESPDA